LRWIYQIPFFSWQNYSYPYFKQIPKYFATELKRPSGTDSPLADTSTQGLNCKTNTIPILMHQMRISTTKVYSVVLRPIKLEIRIHASLWYLFAPLFPVISNEHEWSRYLVLYIPAPNYLLIKCDILCIYTILYIHPV
jgi:hypothetical protein